MKTHDGIQVMAGENTHDHVLHTLGALLMRRVRTATATLLLWAALLTWSMVEKVLSQIVL